MNKKNIRFGVKDEKKVGFCHNPKHKGYLTVKTLKEHECLKKQCFYFQKFEERAYWVSKNKVKKYSNVMRNIRKAYFSHMISLEAFREAEHLYRGNKELFYRKYYYYE